MDVVDFSRSLAPEPVLNGERNVLDSPLRERVAPMGADSGLGASVQQDRKFAAPSDETPAAGDAHDGSQKCASAGIARFQGFPLNLEPTSSSGTRSRPTALSEEDRFQQTTHDLVARFISDSIRKKGYIAPGYERQEPSSFGVVKRSGGLPAPHRSADEYSNGLSSRRISASGAGKLSAKERLEETEEALIALVEDFDHRFWQRFQRMLPSDWLEPNDMESMKNKFLTVSRDLHFKFSSRGVENGNNGLGFQSDTSINWGRIVAHFSFTSHLAAQAAAEGRYNLVEALVDWLSQFLTRFLRSWIQRNGGWEGLVTYRDECALQTKWLDVAGNWAKGVGAGLLLGVFGLVVAKKYLTQ